MLINYSEYAIGESIEECEKYPVKNLGNICVKKKEENKCTEVKAAKKIKKAILKKTKI